MYGKMLVLNYILEYDVSVADAYSWMHRGKVLKYHDVVLQAVDVVDSSDVRIEAPLEPAPVAYTSTMPRILPSQVQTDFNSMRQGAYSTMGYGYSAHQGLVNMGEIGYRPNSVSTNRSYAEEALLIQDLRSPSLSPSPPPTLAVEDNSLYQGEIHLGSLHVPQPEVRQETSHQEFTETRQEYTEQYQMPMIQSSISNAITYQWDIIINQLGQWGTAPNT